MTPLHAGIELTLFSMLDGKVIMVLGSLEKPEGTSSLAPTSEADIDAALSTLQAKAQPWADLGVAARAALCETVITNTVAVAERWVEAACEAKGILMDSPEAGQEWHSGPAITIRNARLLRDSLYEIAEHGTPQVPGKVTVRPNGQTTVEVFPTDTYDKLLWMGYTGEVWMQPGVTPGNLKATMAVQYADGAPRTPSVALVLGAGNVASIPPMDTLAKLMIDNEVVILKMNPVNAYLGPILEEVFASFIDDGYVAIVQGGAEQGKYLTNHEGVDSIHITGSDKTHDAIVFGSGEDGDRRKAANDPLVQKDITSELGNVSPIIIVPGPWSTADIAYQGRNIAGMLTHNAGFNCIAARLVVMHSEWQHREALMASIELALEETTQRKPYYPGARQRWETFLEAHPDARMFGDASDDKVPWTFISGLDATTEDICFTTESFNGVFGEVPLDAPRSVPDFLQAAVAFANDNVWGTLGATIIAHPASLKDPVIAESIDKTIADLRYGTVGLNAWIGLGYAFTSTTWGAFPGHELSDIQSGKGVVHNTYMFDAAEKSVLRAPFKQSPKPLWFGNNKQAHNVTKALVALEADPSPLRFAPVLKSALLG